MLVKTFFFHQNIFTQTIIFNSSPSLLEPYFLPVSQRLKLKCEDLYTHEETLKHATRLESSEREDLETNLMKVRKTNYSNKLYLILRIMKFSFVMFTHLDHY